jgi:3alpha(or 20beta)-hydroxysteroid dehydrogenase
MGALDGKVAIVTGAARGQGAAEARLFAAEGARVVLTDVDERGRQTAAEIGADAVFLDHDVGESADWTRVVDDTMSRFGRLDVLVNNAAIYRLRRLEETTDEEFDAITRVNQRGVFLGLRTAAPAMRRSGGGSIVNISSGAGLKGVPSMIAYSATKWAVRGMTKCAAMELARDRIRVNSVHPGLIETAMLDENPTAMNEAMLKATPIGRIGTPEDVAKLVLYLASDASGFVTGGEFAIDGGAIL